MKTKYKYIEFVKHPGFWQCRNKRTGGWLCDVEWDAQCKQYVAGFNGGAAFSADCLDEISHFLKQLNMEPSCPTK